MASRETHYLLIPHTGLMEVFHAHDELDTRHTLTHRHGVGPFIELVVEVNNDYKFTVAWMNDPVGPVNHRAREAFAMLISTQTIFTGPVMFYDLEPGEVGRIVAQLSRKE